MQETISRLSNLLESTASHIRQTPEEMLNAKPRADKWSKKEILGHLVDSAINNLQRFTEIQFSDKPFQIYRYHQAELVQANAYQEAEIDEYLPLWVQLNKRIIQIMRLQTKRTLSFEILLYEGEKSDLKFLMTDYVDHMEHHVKQILS